MTDVSIRLEEWETCSPEPGTPLAGLSFGRDDTARHIAEQLTRSGRLEIVELAKGILIRASSYVGSVRVGPIRVTVEAKLSGTPLLNLLRYAYGLRNLELHQHIGYGVASQTFQNLLVHQLAEEATELVSRGLHREYLSRH